MFRYQASCRIFQSRQKRLSRFCNTQNHSHHVWLQDKSGIGHERRFQSEIYRESSWGFGGFFQEAPNVSPFPRFPSLSLFLADALKDALIGQSVAAGDVAGVGFTVGFGAFDDEGAFAFALDASDEGIHARTAFGGGLRVDAVDLGGKLMEVGREKAAATDAAQSHQHLGGDIGRLEGAGGGQRLVQEDKAVCRYGIEDLAKARAFLAKASLVNGVVRAGREMGIDAVRRADAAGTYQAAA